ncbi:hypothetical protein ZEAMMB73_Zm00001d046044 [Zea mays]|uniref:Uncharacterized protein n=1 Tax=Zea mays TaxID=4577 RepID=A0A1D6P0P6_MAIZE|nr:hypothetical protein ZEAMMB73_Zm00001d046044 [Zea mays]
MRSRPAAPSCWSPAEPPSVPDAASPWCSPLFPPALVDLALPPCSRFLHGRPFPCPRWRARPCIPARLISTSLFQPPPMDASPQPWMPNPLSLVPFFAAPASPCV